MQRRRRRRSKILAVVLLISSCFSSVSMWTTSTDCPARCALDAGLCLRNGECTPAPPSATSAKWCVVLQDAPLYHFNDVALFPWVKTLELRGDKTRVTFDELDRWTGEHLTVVAFIGLNLTSSWLPPLPTSVTHLRLIDCVFEELPVAWFMSHSHLETLELVTNSLADETQMLMSLTEQEFQLMRSRFTLPTIPQDQVDGVLTECAVVRGRLEQLSGYRVCVVPDEVAVARRLQTLVDTISNEIGGENASLETGRVVSTVQDTPTLVLISMALPFIYFLYKMSLYISFSREAHRDGNRTAVPVTTSKTTDTTDQHRPTTNESTTSPPVSPVAHAHRKQSRQCFGSNNVDFWVDEALQQWRLDFHRLKMVKWLNVPPNEKRLTLRKQSVANATNPREIWLASLASVERVVAGSSEVSPNETLVVAKYLPCEEKHRRRSETNGNGARDKLKSEIKRQAQFSHPHVVSFIGVAWSRETNLIAVTEYMTQGDLRQWLRRTAATQRNAWTVCKLQMLLDVSSALVYMHSILPQLVHGNCNSRNVLLNESLRAKLSDFGVDGRADGLTDQELTSYSAVGSGRWISPEALLGRETCALYPDASDVYSFGILIAEVDSHELPFSDLMQANRSAVPETDILQLIARGALSPTMSPGCPKSIVKLVNACTNYKPKHRPNSTQVQQDLYRILEDFRAVENNTTATISIGAPRSNQPSNLV